jgi:isopenicillin-N N-acyltransferase-like protein
MKASPATPVKLNGSAWDRGIQQSERRPELKLALCQAISDRLELMRNKLNDSEIKTFLEKQRKFTETHSPESLSELDGIAEGYGIIRDDLFTYLHLGVIDDQVDREDGCSVFAIENSSEGPVLAKNRDYQGAHKKLQQVFHSSDPDWGPRQCLFVGSLGSPGAFSSGMNSDGLAIADNRIGWSQPGIGWLRYFLMTKILTDTGSVDEALHFINGVEHVGGGSVVLTDKHGDMASVELGHGKIHVDKGIDGFVAHTNHYLAPELALFATRTPHDPMSASSFGRLEKINGDPIRRSNNVQLNDVAELLNLHEDQDRSLCRHGIDGDALTISSVIFACQKRELYYCPGLPCENDWQVYKL